MKSLFIFSLLAVITALTGCKPEDFQDTGVLSIEDFYIIGSNDNALDEIPEIDPYFNDGEFLLFIRLGKPDLGYELTYYLEINSLPRTPHPFITWTAMTTTGTAMTATTSHSVVITYRT